MIIDFATTEKVRERHYDNYGPKYYQLVINKREVANIDDLYDYEIVKALWAMKDPNLTV